MKHLLAILLAIAPLHALAAKDGYKISLSINGNSDTMMLMCYYQTNGLWAFDTAWNNGKGTFLFRGNRTPLPGLYYFSNQKGKHLDFVIYNNQTHFSIRTDERDWLRNTSVKGSSENELFFRFQMLNEHLYSEMDEAKLQLDSLTFQQEFFPKQIKRIDSARMDFIQTHPDAMISRMMMATKDPSVPSLHPDGTKMTDRERYDWLMAHYFDNVPLNDNFIIRTPENIFYRRVIDYVDVHMRGMPPSMICPLLDSLIDRSQPAPEVFKWLVLTLAEKFLQSKVMVYDEVYVHLIKRYYETGKAFWMSPSGIDKEVERATKWERLLVGRVAPELILFDTLHRAASLHHMPGKYTLLLFWSPTCGHCRDIIPAVYKIYEQYADSLQLSAFSILSEPDDITIGKWKKFLTDHHINHPRWIGLLGGEANVDWREVYDVHTTPQIYLIDNKDNTIIAKKLGADLFEMLCKDLMKIQHNTQQ